MSEYGPEDNRDWETKPFALLRFEAHHETLGGVSGVTCKEWPTAMRYCYFFWQGEEPRKELKSRYTDGAVFEGPVVVES